MLGNPKASLQQGPTHLPHLTISPQWWDAESPLAAFSSHRAAIGGRSSHSAPIGSRRLSPLFHWQTGSRATVRHSLTPLPRPSDFVPAPFPRPSSREGKPYQVTASSFLPISRNRTRGRELWGHSAGRDWLLQPLSRLPLTPGGAGVGWVGGYKGGGRREAPRSVHSQLAVCPRPGHCPVTFG